MIIQRIEKAVYDKILGELDRRISSNITCRLKEMLDIQQSIIGKLAKLEAKVNVSLKSVDLMKKYGG